MLITRCRYCNCPSQRRGVNPLRLTPLSVLPSGGEPIPRKKNKKKKRHSRPHDPSSGDSDGQAAAAAAIVAADNTTDATEVNDVEEGAMAAQVRTR